MTAFLDTPARDAVVAERFWLAVTGGSLSPRRGEFATVLPAAGDAYVRVQVVGDDGPARAHLDLHVADVAGFRRAAVGLGAVELADPMVRSPGGLLFCVVQWHGEQVRPRPVVWGEGRRSFVDQVSLDIPRAGFEAEADFWAELTGWARRPIPGSPFDFLERPAGMPLRLLLQRVDDGPGGMHVDFAGDQVAAEVDRHVALGAVWVRAGDGWVTLRDPAGREYCVTGRLPDID